MPPSSLSSAGASRNWGVDSTLAPIKPCEEADTAQGSESPFRPQALPQRVSHCLGRVAWAFLACLFDVRKPSVWVCQSATAACARPQPTCQVSMASFREGRHGRWPQA